jgi:hypothetical protein
MNEYWRDNKMLFFIFILGLSFGWIFQAATQEFINKRLGD